MFGLNRLFRFLRPKHTIKSVTKELVDGLEDGSIVLYSAHPALSQISLFSLGLSTKEEADRIISHLKVCDRCLNLVNAASEGIDAFKE